MSRNIRAKDYPEHLNPFDDNYSGVLQPTNSREKYNTWSASRPNKVSSLEKPKPTFLEKPWAALNISPKGKLVRRLSIIKSTVEKLAFKKKRLAHSSSYTEGTTARSHSLHDEFNFRIISPKLKEKLRQQAFLRAANADGHQVEVADSTENSPSSPQLNGRLTIPLKLDSGGDQPQNSDVSPTTPEEGKEFSTLGARPKTRKKRPPPPPPTSFLKSNNLELSNSKERTEDSHSANSSITQDLEKDALSEDEISLTELDRQSVSINGKKD